MRILKNLTDYVDKDLSVVNVKGKFYRTNPDFNPSVIVPQSFGLQFREDSYNQVIAQAIKDSRDIFGEDIPAVVEKPFKECLERIGETCFYCFGESYEEYSGSILFSQKGSDWVYKEAEKRINELELNKQRIIYIGHPAHMQRLVSIAKKLGFNGVPFISNKVEWAKNDSQLWVKSKYLWTPREIPTRVHHTIKGIA
ncbi:MAG: hypothetical protein ABIA78_00185 [archaeon]